MYRTIPIQPTLPKPMLVLRAPELLGDKARLQFLVTALQQTLERQVGLQEPASAWLRALHLEPGEAELFIAPGLPYCGHELISAAFDALRTLLPDTDVYVRIARH